MCLRCRDNTLRTTHTHAHTHKERQTHTHTLTHCSHTLTRTLDTHRATLESLAEGSRVRLTVSWDARRNKTKAERVQLLPPEYQHDERDASSSYSESSANGGWGCGGGG